MVRVKLKPDVVKMSSKGQMVVPKKIRKAVNADAGDEFVVFGSGNAIIFKKIDSPSFSVEELDRLISENERKLREAGFVDAESVQSLVLEAVAAVRRNR